MLYTYGNGLLYHFNHIGSTTAVTDEAGAVKYTYTYSVYGELLSGNYGEVAFLYNGQYGVTSDDNGLYYMRARYYNIDIKRFINQDILTGSIDRSQSLNRYAYVEGNTVNFLDPFGLDEYKVDTSTAHTVLAALGAVAFVVGAFASGPVGTVALLLGTAISGLDAGLYINDAIEVDTRKERTDAIIGAGLGIASISTGTWSFYYNFFVDMKMPPTSKEIFINILDILVNAVGMM